MKLTSTLFLSLFVFLILCGQSAVAERYMIKYKNPRSFAGQLVPAGIEVTETLVHIGTKVVDINSARVRQENQNKAGGAREADVLASEARL